MAENSANPWIFSSHPLFSEERNNQSNDSLSAVESISELNLSISSQSCPQEKIDEIYYAELLDTSHVLFEIPALSSNANILLKYLYKSNEWIKLELSTMSPETPTPPPLHINWNSKTKRILLFHRLVTSDFLTYFLLEHSLGLIDSQVLEGTMDKSALPIFEFFAKREIFSELQSRIMSKLILLTINKKSGIHIGVFLLKFVATTCLELVSFGLFKNYLKDEEILFLMKRNHKCFSVFKDLFALDKFVKLENIRSQTAEYEPWLIILRKSLLLIQNEYQDFLLNDSAFVEESVYAVIQWLNQPSKINLISWIFEFLFRDFYDESKRKFLYLEGDSDTGKTSFITQCLLPDKYFQTMFLDTQHFVMGAKKGDYELHCMIFDDPGTADGKNNRLSGEFFLNLARYDTQSQKAHSFNIKHGHFKVRKGQICFISNRGEEKIFQKSHQKSISTRLLKIYFDKNSPFPLAYCSPLTQPLILKPLNSDYEIQQLVQQTTMPFPSQSISDSPSLLVEEDDNNNEDDDVPLRKADDSYFHSHDHTQQLIQPPSQKIFKLSKLTDEERRKRNQKLSKEKRGSDVRKDIRLTKDLVFYFTWRGVLALLQSQIPLQSSDTLALFIPNHNLRNRILENTRQGISLYEILISHLTERELKLYLNL